MEFIMQYQAVYDALKYSSLHYDNANDLYNKLSTSFHLFSRDVHEQIYYVNPISKTEVQHIDLKIHGFSLNPPYIIPYSQAAHTAISEEKTLNDLLHSWGRTQEKLSLDCTLINAHKYHDRSDIESLIFTKSEKDCYIINVCSDDMGDIYLFEAYTPNKCDAYSSIDLNSLTPPEF